MSDTLVGFFETPIMMSGTAARSDFTFGELFFEGENIPSNWLPRSLPQKYKEQQSASARDELVIQPKTKDNFIITTPDTNIHETGQEESGGFSLIDKFFSSFLSLGKSASLQRATAKKTIADVNAEILELFSSTEYQAFDEVIENQFATELRNLVENYGVEALTVISRLILSEQVDGEVSSVVLRQLGMMRDSLTKNQRLTLIVASLESSSSWTRYGAILALSWLNDPNAIQPLQEALPKEGFSELRQIMERVLNQLEGIH